MGYSKNGYYYPTIATGQAICGCSGEKFRTRQEKVRLFLRTELNDCCRRFGVKDDELINVACSLYGVEFSVNGSGQAKRRIKTKATMTTRLTRIYTSANYLVRYNPQSGRYEEKEILGDEEWLTVENVAAAFRRICRSRENSESTMERFYDRWRPSTLTAPQLSQIKMADGFGTMALTAAVEDEMGKRHLLACLLMNGLLMYDVEAEVVPVEQDKNLLRVADCVFRIEGEAGRIRGFTRV